MTLNIKAAREVVAGASPGPWEAAVWIETDGNEWRATGPGHEDESSDHGSEPGCPDEQAAQADARFIAAARTGWPEALDEVERLEAELDELRTADLRGMVSDLRGEHAYLQKTSEEEAGDLATERDTLRSLASDLMRERDGLRGELGKAHAIIAEFLPHPNGPRETTPGDPDAWNSAMFNLGRLRDELATATTRAAKAEAELCREVIKGDDLQAEIDAAESTVAQLQALVKTLAIRSEVERETAARIADWIESDDRTGGPDPRYVPDADSLAVLIRSAAWRTAESEPQEGR
jgi:hypothetical protein